MRYLVLFAVSCGAALLLSCTKETDAKPLNQGNVEVPVTSAGQEAVPSKLKHFTVPRDCKVQQTNVAIEYKNIKHVSFNYVECPKTKIVFSARPDPFYAKTLSAVEVNDPSVSKVYLKKTSSTQSYSSAAFEIFYPYTLDNFYSYLNSLPQYCKLNEVLLDPENKQSPRTFQIIHTDKKPRPRLPKNASDEERKRHRVSVKEVLDHNWSCEETERIYFWFDHYIVSSTKTEIVDLTSIEIWER